MCVHACMRGHLLNINPVKAFPRTVLSCIFLSLLHAVVMEVVQNDKSQSQPGCDLLRPHITEPTLPSYRASHLQVSDGPSFMREIPLSHLASKTTEEKVIS